MELPIKGEFDAVFRNQTCGKRTTFLVIKGKIRSPPLISKNTLTELDMLQIDENPNEMRILGNMANVHAVVNTVFN